MRSERLTMETVQDREARLQHVRTRQSESLAMETGEARMSACLSECLAIEMTEEREARLQQRRYRLAAETSYSR